MMVRVINLQVSSLVFLMLKLFIIIYKGYMFFRNSEKDDEESNSENSKDKLPEQNDNSKDGEESAVKYDRSYFEDDEDYEDYDENYDNFEEHPEEEQSNEENQKKREKGIVIYGRLNMVI